MLELQQRTSSCSGPAVSLVIPVHNEAGNIEPVAREIQRVLGSMLLEIIFVDDGSSDATAADILALRQCIPQIRLLRHAARRGQSAALRTGVAASRSSWVATLDGDGQNDPADIPRLVEAAMRAPNAGETRLVIGHRTVRQDSWMRRAASRIANTVRRCLLDDRTPDTGCGIKVMNRDTFLALPYFDHMHRFLPALFRRAGAQVVSVPVRHRPRLRGRSKYGIADRLWVGVVDLLGVRWLMRRAPLTTSVREE